MSDYLAAKLGDPLEHSSLLGDLCCGLTQGIIYAAIYYGARLAVGVAVGVFVGTGGLAAPIIALVAVAVASFVVGDNITAIGDFVSDLVDSIFGKAQDGKINTGSSNVHIKNKPAARAAGKIDVEILKAEKAADSAEEKIPESNSALDIAANILLASCVLTPIGINIYSTAITTNLLLDQLNSDNPAAPLPPPENDKQQELELEQQANTSEEQKSFIEEVVDDFMAPTVAQAHEAAQPALLDTITCEKWHYFSSEKLFLAEGSKSVLINGQPACRNGDRSTCEAKIAHTQDKMQVKIGGKSVTVRDIKSGRNPFATLTGELIGSLGPKAFKKLSTAGWRAMMRYVRRETACMLSEETIITTLSHAAKRVAPMLYPVIAIITRSNHPVHFATGAKLLSGKEEQDFILNGRIPLIWQRLYNSRNPAVGLLGRGWRLPFEVTLRIVSTSDSQHANTLIYTDQSGRELGLGIVGLGQTVFYPDEGIRLYRSTMNIFMIETIDGEYQLFEVNPLKPGWLRLAKTLDRHQNSLSYHYNVKGQLTHIDDDMQQLCVRLSYLSDNPQRLHAVYQQSSDDKAKERQLIRYNYDQQYQLISVTDGDDYVTRRFGYDPTNHLMNFHQYTAGLTAHYRWQRHPGEDEYGEPCWRVAESWVMDESGERQEVNYFEYDLAKRELILHQQGLGTSYRRWDKLGQITDFTDVEGNHYTLSWNKQSNLTKFIDPQGGEYHFHYDDMGNLELAVNPLGEVSSIKWDKAFFVPLIESDPNGACWRYRYNKYGDLITVTDPNNQQTHYVYNELGDQIEVIDALGNHYHYRYNQQGLLTTQIDCSGYRSSLFYDEWGVPELSQNAVGDSVKYTFSNAGRLRAIKQIHQHEQHFDYNDKGLLSGVKDFDDTITQFSYNHRGQLTEQRKANNQRIRYHYDGFGRLIRLNNEKNEAYHFGYTASHQLSWQRDLSGQTTCYRYNRLGLPLLQTEFPDSTGEATAPIFTHYQYDALGRITRRTNHETVTEYQYQKHRLTLRRASLGDWANAQNNGQPLKSEQVTELTFELDDLEQIISEHNHGGRYQYQYDALGNLLTSTLPDGYQLHHLYYGAGHLSQLKLTTPDQHNYPLADYERDRLHREISRTQGALTQSQRFDNLGRMTQKYSCITELSNHAQPLIDKRFDYDRAGNLIGQANSYGNYPNRILNKSPRYSENYHYDSVQQITGLQTHYGQHHIAYDPAGNLLNDHREAIQHNRLTHYNGYYYRYDGFGRLIERRHPVTQLTQQFFYNSQHQLIEARVNDIYHRSTTLYTYDALGRRTRKSTKHDDKYEKRQHHEQTDFFWQGMRLSGEQHSTQPDQRLHYIYNQDSYEPIARVMIETNLNTQSESIQLSRLRGG